jgi:hypothetical protein
MEFPQAFKPVLLFTLFIGLHGPGLAQAQSEPPEIVVSAMPTNGLFFSMHSHLPPLPYNPFPEPPMIFVEMEPDQPSVYR